MSVPARTVLITGATDGVGYETARLLAEEGCVVIVHARTLERGEEALARMVQGGADAMRLRLAVADFASFSEVATMAHLVADAHSRIDVLVNNAATAGENRQTLTEDGHEQTWQVNYLSHYLLTMMLERSLTHARLVNLSSTLHRGANIHWTDLNRSGRYSRGGAYAQSKLAMAMFAKALPEFGPVGVSAVSVHPGILATNLLHAYSLNGRPASEGAAVVTRLCSSTMRVVNGGYYNEQLRHAPTSAEVQNRRSVERLWDLSAQLTGMGSSVS
nr:SDR family NAD(P)-dependent oxidoreductase [Kibdelosporangium sp. MJ126-NF4]CEL17414.1 probable oxidoreductase/Short-chain dehydrogenase [Kibdelosporangium sp. MJ126-NF4]CTQ91359.1 probable oxidoreductase/Short-chain dehydrogenase [Kibdelosporangium sp. MJ126-NF4]